MAGEIADVFDAAALAHQHHVRRVEIGEAEIDVVSAGLGARHARGDKVDAVLAQRRNALGIDDGDFLGCNAEPFSDPLGEIDILADDALARLAEAERWRTFADAD